MSTSHTNGKSVKLECGCSYSCSREDEGDVTPYSPVKCFPESMCERHAVYWREVVPREVENFEVNYGVEVDPDTEVDPADEAFELVDEVIETVRGLGFRGLGVKGEIHFIPSQPQPAAIGTGLTPGVSTLICKIRGMDIFLNGKTDSDVDLPITITRRGLYTLHTRIDYVPPSSGSS